ncbi:substrate-binding domain-containing protein [Lachnoclostridium sp. Marseille-P6806]|uniref:substrate-binding domain-containing protein n=1 Tax=Lachnoclostridium sp. Marseille-P6806 TaxID=2364793 RepID=UPI001F5F4380|nr:substrate-binding domain-containing protein [Lachnoclostridium sp. Marseille-P6806]
MRSSLRPPIIESIMEYCEAQGYRVTVHNLRLYARWADTWYNQEEAYHSILDPVLSDILSARADGAIYIAGHARVIHCFDENFPIPAVMAYARSGAAGIPSVVIDDVRSAREVVDCLLGMGHRRIGFIGGRKDNLHTQLRLQGYREALEGKGIPFDPELVYYGDWSRGSGCQGARTLSEKGVGVFFSISDQMAGGIYDYADEAGKEIGKDISVGSFDNQEIAQFFRPGLTTTALPLTEIGRESAKILIGRIEWQRQKTGPSGERKLVEIPCTMVRRSSIADARCTKTG